MHHAVLERTQIDLATREAVHDLRNLFGIVASARHLLSDTMTDERRRVVLDAIEGAAIRGGQLTTQLLATHGSVASVFDLSSHLRALEPMLRAIAGSRVALRYDLATPGAAVNVDPNALEATVLEMVTNARAACHADGTIILRTRSISGRLWLTVADDGQGMDRDTLRACLAARAPGAHGSGLGRIRQFARHAHARFHIRSRANRGTVICLNLPAAPTKADESVRSADRATRSKAQEDAMPAAPIRPIARHAVIVCHPAAGSFNHAVADAYCETVRACGQEPVLRDLYAMKFDPVLRAEERPTAPDFTVSPDVVAEQAILRDCDAFVLIYPIWFGTPPALLKGYVERVLGSGVDPKAVEMRTAHGLLKDKRLISFSSSAASDAWLNEQGEVLALRMLFDRYLVRAFSMRDEQHFHFPRIVPDLRARFVDENIAVVRQHAHRLCGEFLIEHHRIARTNETA